MSGYNETTPEASGCPYQMNELLDLMLEQGASDLHIQVGQPPTLRIDGLMTTVEGPALRAGDTEDLMRAISPDVHQERLKTKGGADFGFSFM
ncbi:MAG TPA: hypothetical protein PKI32_01905, partial [Opitutales bacterium]|nr:hypothetical protein [Opitutales bacterium]